MKAVSCGMSGNQNTATQMALLEMVHVNITICYYGKMDRFAKYRFADISNFTVL